MKNLSSKVINASLIFCVMFASIGYTGEVVQRIETQAAIEPRIDPRGEVRWPNITALANRFCRENGFKNAQGYNFRRAFAQDFFIGQYLKYFYMLPSSDQSQEKMLELDLKIKKVVYPNSAQAYLNCRASGGSTRWVYFKNKLNLLSEAMLLTEIDCAGEQEVAKNYLMTRAKAAKMAKMLEDSNREWLNMSF